MKLKTSTFVTKVKDNGIFVPVEALDELNMIHMKKLKGVEICRLDDYIVLREPDYGDMAEQLLNEAKNRKKNNRQYI